MKDIELIDYFPSKLAKGQQFCNRIAEQKTLKRNIELGRHTVLVSPRRYGKSSLVHQVARDVCMPFAGIDLFLAHDEETVIKKILTGISQVVSQLIPFSQKALTAVQHYFSRFKVTFTNNGWGIELSQVSPLADSIDQLFDALKSLTHLAEEKKKKILFFIDEFQDITIAENSKAIQGTIRHIAQDTSWIVFVFSGSSRNLLLNLFDDKNKPLYMLCDKILLDRMLATDYYPHLQQAAKQRWHHLIDDEVINRILILTELHPFYVNFLCNELWKMSRVPTVEDVTAAWLICYETEERRLIAELEKLTSNQQNILKILATNPTREPTGQRSLSLMSMSLSSVRMGIKSLVEKDMVYIVKRDDASLPGISKGQYRVLDPLLAFALRKYS